LHTDDLPDSLAGTHLPEPTAIAGSSLIRVAYQFLNDSEPLPSGILAAVRFAPGSHRSQAPGAHAPDQGSNALQIDVALQPLHGRAPAELWFATGPVRTGHEGSIRYAHDDNVLFAALEVDEREHGGIRAATEWAYARIGRFQQATGFPHTLRIWNYFDAINEGAGDQERYRQFCVGRVHGLGDAAHQRYPAATTIGCQHTTWRLQIFWLADRHPGDPIENPRQLSAYHYPRTYGPVSPTFSRATIARDGTMLVSGTASIVGHVSRHHDDPVEQLEEILRNLAALDRGSAPPREAKTLLKVYVRGPQLLASIAARLKSVHPRAGVILLAGDICRRELLIEIECLRCA
jgi:chorismate lyase/3-hydroxybenzoate synthase